MSKFKSYTTFRAEAEKGPGLEAGAVSDDHQLGMLLAVACVLIEVLREVGASISGQPEGDDYVAIPDFLLSLSLFGHGSETDQRLQ